MKYARHFILTFLIFVAILFVGLFLDNQPFGNTGNSSAQYVRPVSVDVCNQTIPTGLAGQYQSQNCNYLVNRDFNYYYYGTVNSVSGQYVPYVR